MACFSAAPAGSGSGAWCVVGASFADLSDFADLADRREAGYDLGVDVWSSVGMSASCPSRTASDSFWLCGSRRSLLEMALARANSVSGDHLSVCLHRARSSHQKLEPDGAQAEEREARAVSSEHVLMALGLWGLGGNSPGCTSP